MGLNPGGSVGDADGMKRGCAWGAEGDVKIEAICPTFHAVT